MKTRRILMGTLALAMVAATFFACSKEKETVMESSKPIVSVSQHEVIDNCLADFGECIDTTLQIQATACLSSPQRYANPYDSIFSQYWNRVVEALCRTMVADSTISYEEWVAKADSALSHYSEPSFSSFGFGENLLGDSSYQQVFNRFLLNIDVIGVSRSAELAERQLWSASCDENERNACLCVLSCMKTMMLSMEDMQDYLPGPGYYRYLDCMREKHGNMNTIEWVQFILGLPGSLSWEVLSCIWEATHYHANQ